MSISRTKEEIFKQMREEMPWKVIGEEQLKPYILEAMQVYADQESRVFANWLSNTVVAGRTMDKLFKDYKDEIGYKQICYKLNEPCKFNCSGLCRESV